MQNSLWLTGAALTVLTLGACNKAQSPADVQHDVMSAASTAADKNAQASDKLADVASTVNGNLSEANQKADAKMAAAAADAAVTAAEGQHKIALAKCSALAGDAQKACRDQADAALDMARANARAAKARDS